MKLVRRVHNGQAAIVRDREGRDHLVRHVKVVLYRMANYFVRLLTGILDHDGTIVQIVLERVHGVLERLTELAKAIIPPVFGLRFRCGEKLDFTLVWGGRPV